MASFRSPATPGPTTRPASHHVLSNRGCYPCRVQDVISAKENSRRRRVRAKGSRAHGTLTVPNEAQVGKKTERVLVSSAPLLHHAIRMPWFFSGNERIRLPVAANMALRTAGAATKMVGSPTPPQKLPDGI